MECFAKSFVLGTVAILGSFLGFAVALATMVLMCMLEAPAKGAGIPTPTATAPTQLSQNFDLGDINGGYSTYYYPDYYSGKMHANLVMYLGGQHVIDSTSINMYPNYQYKFDDKGNFVSKVLDGYNVNASVSGSISKLLTTADIGYGTQSNRFDARGLNIEEYSYWQVSADYGPASLQSSAGSSINILNFMVENAYGNYDEYSYSSYPNGTSDPNTYFSYNVTWRGDFMPGTVASGFTMNPMSTMVASSQPVPEPSTMAMLLVAGLGVVAWRKKSATKTQA